MSIEILRKVQAHAVEALAWSKQRTTNLHIQTEVLRENSVIRAHRQEIPVKRQSIMVFADDAPHLNWSHPCRYLLYDARNGDLYQEVHAEFPPYLVNTPDTFQAFHTPVRLDAGELLWPIRPRLRCPIRWPKGQRYAVLFSGASNNRHTNDLEFLYRSLRDLYGFRDDHIYSLNYDGAINYNGGPKPVGNWPGDNTPYRMPVKGQGTKAALEAVFDDLKGKLKADDFLLVHTNNHGGLAGPGKAYLVTYSGPDYFAADFAAKLGTFPPFYCLMVMMEQCHSGGFNAPILAQSKATCTTVSSACTEANNSIGGAQFDPFARDWISAMAGHTPSGGALAFNPDTDGSGKVSAREAHQYADAVHDPFDTPVYSENSVAAGNTHLGQRYVWWWWWWCPEFVKLVEPHYIRLPIPEFYERLQARVLPELEELETSLDQSFKAQQNELTPKLKRLITAAFQ